jgi:hypothetical protein
MAEYKDLSADLNVITFKIVIGNPILSADFQNLAIPYVGTANPQLTDVDITDYEFSINNGVSYSSMTLTGSVITGLTFGTAGTAHTLTWAAKTDLSTLLYNTQLVIRLMGYSATQGLSTLPATKSFIVPREVTQANLANTSPFPPSYKGLFGPELLKNAPKSVTRA